MVKIYAIKNPLSGKVLYVGASLRPQRRFFEHYYGGTWKSNTDRYKIMRELRLKKIIPELVILDECEIDKAKALEQFWIDFYICLGHNLDQQKRSGYARNNSVKYRQEARQRLGITSNSY